MKLHVGSILIGTCVGVALVVLLSSVHTDTLSSRLRRASKGAHHFQQLVDEAHTIVEKRGLGNGALQSAGLAVTAATPSTVRQKVPSADLKRDHQIISPHEDLSERPHHEHIEVLKEGKYHAANKDNWEEQSFSQPYLDGEREIPCEGAGAANANALNSQAVASIRGIVDDDDKAGPLPDFSESINLFRDAAKSSPNCPTPRLNLVILQSSELCSFDKGPFLVNLDAVAQLDKELADILPLVNHTKQTAKVHWYRGILEELRANQSNSAGRYFREALKLDPSLKLQHVHRTRQAYTTEVLRAVQRPVDYLYRKGLVQLLFYYEFAPRMGGYGKVTYADTQRFLRDWHVKIEKNLPPFVLAVVSRMYRLSFDNPLFPPIIGAYAGAASHESNGDCLNAWYNMRMQQIIEKISGIKVSATYGYTAGYKEGDVLKPHTDRKACEFTLTTLIQAYPHVNYCPLYAQKTPWQISRKWVGRYEDTTINYGDSINIHPQLNELIVLRGRAVPHYRPPLPADVTCTTFLQHYVPLGEPEV